MPEAAASIAERLEAAARRLRDAGVAEPRRDAATLMALVLGTDRGGVAVRKSETLSTDAADRFEILIAERAERRPLQYLEGFAEFRGLELAVGPGVLIPRPETEDLVQAVLDGGLPDRARVADLGTGSGCIAIALACERPDWSLVAVDVSPAALTVARSNAKRHGVDERITFLETDFCDAALTSRAPFDAVVSNPPYVAEAEWCRLMPEVRDHEPKGALVPGPTGLEAYAGLIPAASALLVPGGLLALELGWKSEHEVRAVAARAGYASIAVRDDLQHLPRVLTALKGPS